jgi:hypothetical protein
MALDDLKHAQKERLIYLDRCLTWRGIANRKDLIERFGISAAQAALDFRDYLKLARETPPTYDPVRKTYIAADVHRPLAPSSLTEAFEILVEGRDEDIPTTLPRPERMANPKIIARLHQTIRSKCALHIRYTSMSSGVDDGQWIAPTRFTSDGESVHLRAFSFKHNEYRDYLPIRISADSAFDERSLSEPLPCDSDWYTLARIWLRPRSDLSPEQASVVRVEYGFSGDLLALETRKAMEFYLLRRWRLGESNSRLEIAKTDYSQLTI